MSTEIATTGPDHLIIWLDESCNSNKPAVMDSEYNTDIFDLVSVQVDNSCAQNTAQFQQEIKRCFPNGSEDFRIFHNLDQFQHCINENVDKKLIFLIISTSTTLKIFPYWQKKWDSIKKIYILGNLTSSIVDWMDHYREHGVDILLFDLHKNLLIRLLQDISQYYLAKGKNLKSHVLSSTNLAVPYFNWAKELMVRANQVTENNFKDQLKNIETHKNAAHKLLTRTDSSSDVDQQLKSYILEEVGDSVAIIFIIGMDIKLIHQASGIAQLITCTSDDQVVSAIKSVDISTRSIVVSSSVPSDDVLPLAQLLNYYCLLKPEESDKTPMTNYSNVTYVSSMDHLMRQLYHKLGEYYRHSAMQVPVKSENRDKIMRLLDRSTQCYRLLEDDTKKILKQYAELLNKKTDADTSQQYKTAT
ncbi:unnamed protein product [Adineta steineri]|uniref:Uncharacterized protein n=1 Tax=Adineta steineri TaxID=433720 RepID=A0A818TVB3_9BILA|nr:unnamed protein product [Adineta steineri]CAF3689251.1 unnamed protein product [Adineta steineri]